EDVAGVFDLVELALLQLDLLIAHGMCDLGDEAQGDRLVYADRKILARNTAGLDDVRLEPARHGHILAFALQRDIGREPVHRNDPEALRQRSAFFGVRFDPNGARVDLAQLDDARQFALAHRAISARNSASFGVSCKARWSARSRSATQAVLPASRNVTLRVTASVSAASPASANPAR